MALWPAGTDIQELCIVAGAHNIYLSRSFLCARITLADFQTWQGRPGVPSQERSCCTFGVRLRGVASLFRLDRSDPIPGLDTETIADCDMASQSLHWLAFGWCPRTRSFPREHTWEQPFCSSTALRLRQVVL